MMSQNNNNNNNNNDKDGLNPIIIDFTSIHNPDAKDNDNKYEITETAARLSNQLIRDYPRLAQNEKTVITCFESLIEELGRLHRCSVVRNAIYEQFNYNALLSLVKSLTGMVLALRKSQKVSKEIIEVIRDVGRGVRMNLH